MTTQHDRRVENVVVRDKAQAHFGDVNHYHGAPPTQLDPYQILLTSLTYDHMDERIRNIAAALPKTSSWLPSRTLFARWADDTLMSEHNGFLWLKGKPGSGKSTVMKETLHWAKQNWSDKVVLSYFFNARSPNILEKSSLGLYRSLVWQLQTVSSISHTLFVQRFRSKIRQANVNGETHTKVEEWTEEELQDFLVTAIRTRAIPATTIFVDALDEGADDDVRAMVSFLETWTEHAMAAASLLRICLSSRHYPHISVAKSLSVIMEDQVEHDRDIRLYISRKLGSEGKPGMNEIWEKVRDRSSGVFLWVVLVVPILRKAFDQGRDTSTILRKVDTIPPNLHDVFTQVLFRDPDDLDECITALQWVLFTMQPLSPVELYCAIHFSCKSIERDDQPIDVTPEAATKYLLHCTRGLVELTKTNRPVVQFIHETVRDYLTDNIRLKVVPPKSHSLMFEQVFETTTCNEILAEGCLRCLLQDFGQFTSRSILYSQPLADHAARFWWQYLRASRSSSGHRVYEQAMQLLTKDPGNLLYWVELYDSNNGRAKRPRNIGSLAPPLHHAALIGIEELVLGVLALGADINETTERYGSALRAASKKGLYHIVRLLLDKGADINTFDGPYTSALAAASEEGHLHIVHLLLDRGADDYNNALSKASYGGHEQIVQLLLDKGADGYNSPLLSASTGGHEQIVRMLIEKGADVNYNNIPDGTVLNAASGEGYGQIVQMLLDNGANDYDNALESAIAIGHEQIVKMLLQKGANANFHNDYEYSPLEEASVRGYKQIVQILLDNGANGLDRALESAVDRGHEQIVQVLIAKGANVNFKDRQGLTVLELANIEYGRGSSMVQIFLDHGASYEDVEGCLTLVRR